MRRSLLARSALVFLLLAGVAIAVVAHRVHLDRPTLQSPENGDLYRYIHPTAVFLERELARGHFPLWNPYQYAGEPVLAAPNSQLLYPPHLMLLSLLRPARALEGNFVLHLLIAGWFTWLFAGRLGLSPAARLTAALGYMLSGPLLLGLYMLPLICTEAWLPAILWALHGLASEARPRWALALAVCLGLAFLAGYPQGFAYEAQIATVYGVFALITVAPRGARWRVVGLAALSALLTLGLVAPQLFPTLELVSQGTRSFGGHSFQNAAFGSVHPLRLLRGMLGQLAPDDLSMLPGPMRRYVTLPVLALPLAACGLLARRQRAHWWLFLGAAVVAGLFLLGRHTPVFVLYYSLPLGSLFRIPLRMAFAYLFFVSLLAAIGVQGAAEGLARRRLPARVPRAAAAFLALLIGIDGYTRVELPLAHPVLADPGPGGPAELIEFLREQPGRQRMFVENRSAMLVDLTLLYRVGMLSEVFAVPDYESLLPAAYLRYFHTERDALRHGYLSVLPEERRRPAPTLARLLDLMSVRYYVLPQSNPPEILAQFREFVGGAERSIAGMPWIERESSLPRAYAVRRTHRARSAEAALARITRAAFQPESEAVVEIPGPGGVGFADLEPAPSASPPAPDRAEITSYGTGEVALDAQCGGDCLLVLTDLHYPGWRAWVDGLEQPVYRVNALFRGVRLGPGSHQVVYRFEPASWRIGWAWLFATLVATALLALAQRLRAAQPAPERKRIRDPLDRDPP